MSATNSLTRAVTKYLNHSGFTCWRQNQVAAPGRKFVGVLGLPDVIGYNRKTGQFIAVEIKTGKDTLSLAQIEFGINALEGGALWFEAHEIGQFINSFEFAMKDQRPIMFQARIAIMKDKRNELLTKTKRRKK